MKFDRLWQSLLLTSYIAVFIAAPAQAEKPEKEIRATKQNIPQLGDIELPATSAKLLVQQPAPTNPNPEEVIAITGVKANPTEKGVEVILETTAGDKLQVANRSTGNNFIADITGGQLRLPDGNAFTFKSEKPLEGITEITVTNIDANTVRVTVAGEKALPAVELFDDNVGLIFTVAPTTTIATEETPPQEQPTDETPEEQPAAQEDNPIELVVTGEQDNYRVPDTSVGTRTDTPLRDIPQSIQVVPRQVIQDTQARSITQALENVPGLISQGAGTANTRDYFTARGFEQYDALVNGLPDQQITSDGNIFNVERIEVLRGPASVLYGDSGNGSVGALINYVTRRPLSNPFFQVEASAGNYGFYQGTIDISRPLNSSKSVLGRLIAGYRNYDSPVEFATEKTFGVAPSLSLPGFSVQSGKQRSRGIELDVSGEILPGLNIIAGYAYTDARILEDNDIPVGNRLFNAPEHAVNLWTTYRIQSGAARGLGFGLGLYYIGDRPIDNANTVNLPGFVRTDAAIFYETDEFRAALNIRNLFNIENYVSNYGSSDFVNIGTPFTIQGSLSWRF